MVKPAAKKRVGPSAIRAGERAPRGSLAVVGAPTYCSWSDFRAPRAGSRYVAFLADKAPKTPFTDKVIDIDGALVVRRSLAEAALESSIEAGLVALHPVELSPFKVGRAPRFDRSPIVDDFCVVDALVEVAADRRGLESAGFAWTEQADAVSRERVLLNALMGEPFGEGRTPVERVFRLHDLPSDLWVQPELRAALAKVFGSALVDGRTRPSPPFVASAEQLGYLRGKDADAERAADAFFTAIQAGRIIAPSGKSKLSKSERTAILASPRYAYLLARREGPADDTRQASLGFAPYALLYARDVDHGGRDDTRRAAAENQDLALRYAVEADRGPHAVTRAALAEWNRQTEYDKAMASLPPTQAGAAPSPQAATAAKGSSSRASGAPAMTVVRLKGANENASVCVPWSPNRDLAWGLAIADDDVQVDIAHTSPATAAKIKSIIAFADHGWVLRRDVAEGMFEGVSGAALRRVRVVHRGKVLKADHVYIDVTAELPLDRDRAKSTYSDPERPWSAVALTAQEIVPLSVPGNGLQIARVTEFPHALVIGDALLARWKKLKAPVASVPVPHTPIAGMPVFPHDDQAPPFPKADDAKAAKALRALLAGDQTQRSAALHHPAFAYAIARLVDQAARDETRASAARHPHYAALYARFVDATPTPVTRASAAKTWATAMFYARYVDRTVTPEIEKALLSLGSEPADIQELEQLLEEARAHA